jgi:hypothetical protein
MQKWQHITTFVGMSAGFFKWYIVDFFNFKSGKVGSIDFHVGTSDWHRLLFFKAFWFVLHIIVSIYYQGVGTTVSLLFVYMIIGAQYLENIFIVNHIQGSILPYPSTRLPMETISHYYTC